MLPRWHIFLGAIFTATIWIFAPEIKFIYLSLVFLSSFLIDFDHYLVAILNTNKLSIRNSLKYFECLAEKERKEKQNTKREKKHFYIFHTLEFHIFVLLLSLVRIEFFYIFLGMIFHSLLDVAWMIKKDRLYKREFLLVNWLKENSNKTNKSFS